MSQHDALKIEKVSDTEVWLLDKEGKRLERICGKTRPGIPDEFPCTEPAGKGTKHEGEGYCELHDIDLQLVSKPRNTYEILIDPERKKSVLDYLALSAQDNSEHHTSVDHEIELLESIIAKLLDTNKDTLTTRVADEIAKVVQKLGNLKKIKIDTLKKEKLDNEVIARFLKSILGIIKMHTSQQTSKLIIGD